MSGVQHLDDFSHDLVAAQPCPVRKPCVDEIREHVTAVLTAGDPLLDNANNGVHLLRRTWPHHDQGRCRITAGSAGVVFSIRLREREYSGASLAGSVPFQVGVQHESGSNPGGEDTQFAKQAGLALGSPRSQHVACTLGDDGETARQVSGAERGAQQTAAGLPSRSLERRQTITPMTAVGVLDERWLAEARLELEEKLTNLGRPIDEDARRVSEVEPDHISVALRESCQEAEHVRAPALVVRCAAALALWAGWGCRHQSTISGRMAAQP